MWIRYCSALLLLSCAFGWARADDASDRAERMIRAGDQDKNGKFEWKEAFERWNNARQSMQVADGDEALEEKVRAAFPELIEALDFLAADTNDDLVLTRKELLESFKIEAAGKELKATRKDLEVFYAEVVNESWPAICKIVDTNADGALSRAELDDNYPTKVNDDCFKAADKNKSASLDKTEYAAFKVEEHERGLFVEFDERGGSVGGAGGTGAQAGEDGPEKEKDKKAEAKKGDAEKKTEVKERKSSRIKVGTTWLMRYRIEYKSDDGSGDDKWRYQLCTITAIATKSDETTVDWKHASANEKGEAIDQPSGGGSRVLYTGKNAKYLPPSKDLVTVTVTAGTFDCEVREIKDYPMPGKAGEGKKCVAKYYTAYVDGFPLIVKMECEGVVMNELLEFKE